VEEPYKTLEALAAEAVLNLQSDYAVTLFSAIALEDSLERLLLVNMQLSDDAAEDAFGERRRLESFGAKINEAYDFKLIDDDLRQDLRAIKDIRNTFAHHPRTLSRPRGMAPVSFATPEIAELVRGKLGWEPHSKIKAFDFFKARVVACLSQIDHKFDESLYRKSVSEDGEPEGKKSR
jgi:hypothetical protein